MALLKNIKIVTWNANSVKSKVHELVHFIQNHKYDIVGICETKVDDKYKINIPGYSVYRNDRNSRGGGVAIAVKDNIQHVEVILEENSSIESVGILIKNRDTDLFVVESYIPPAVVLKNQDLDKLFNKYPKTIVMGDFNCRRPEWNCTTGNQNGKELLEYCLNNNINIIAPLECTNYPPVGQPGIIDFFLSRNMDNKLTDPIVRQELSSDHNPVETIINEEHENLAEVENSDYNKANWLLFRDYLNNVIDLNFYIENRSDVERKSHLLVQHITQAMNIAIPKKTVVPTAIELPDHIKNIIKQKNKMRKRYQNSRDRDIESAYKVMEKNVKQLISQYKRRKWEALLKNSSVSTGGIWKIAKRYTKKTICHSGYYECK